MMKRQIAGIWAISAIVLFVTTNHATAQTVKVRVDEDGVKVQAPGVRVDGKPFGLERTANHLQRVSKTIGADVKNSEGTSLGVVDDLVIDEHGQLHYLILRHGGVLGVGQKYCAIPVRVIALKRKVDSEIPWVELNISPKVLEKANSFTSDKWPDFHNETFVRETNAVFVDVPGANVRIER
jgi:sporulation protein YlmC with PRC-barrel domain